MFEKNDIVFHEALGVCTISDIQKLSIKKEEGIPYYILKKIKNKTKVAYVPVDNHKTLLRKLISLEEAKKIIEIAKSTVDGTNNSTVSDNKNNKKESETNCNYCNYSDIEIEEAKYVITINKKSTS